ncbi:hypothetical protein Pfo_003776 [Paulownia fortunei]|nr:hypothetical protein Pfo_003776 [Paulownia fortunei]
MGKKCHIVGNSRTCNTSRVPNFGDGVRLFGVQLDISYSSSNSMKKIFSLDCLCTSTPASSSLSSARFLIVENSDRTSIGYLFDGPLGRALERKKESRSEVGVGNWTWPSDVIFNIGDELSSNEWRCCPNIHYKDRQLTLLELLIRKRCRSDIAEVGVTTGGIGAGALIFIIGIDN